MTETPAREGINPVNLLIVAALIAVLLLSCAAVYSAWVSGHAHSNNCTSRKLTVNAFNDLIALAFTPKPGTTPTVAQLRAEAQFEAKAAPFINQILC